MKAEIFVLHEHRIFIQYGDYMLRYPKPSVYCFVFRSFCDSNGKVYSMLDKTGWT